MALNGARLFVWVVVFILTFAMLLVPCRLHDSNRARPNHTALYMGSHGTDPQHIFYRLSGDLLRVDISERWGPHLVLACQWGWHRHHIGVKK